jgi:hypothetical protein
LRVLVLTLASLVALLLAVPGGVAAQSGVNPVGEYEFTSTGSGAPMRVAMQIRRSDDGSFTGTLNPSQGGAMTISAVEVDGDAMTIRVNTPQGPAVLEVELHGTHLIGTWRASGMSGTLEGQKRPG